MRRLALVAVLFSLSSIARADAPDDRFSAGGYFRVMTRPDLQGGNNALGVSDLYGRLLNEGPYAMLALKLNMLQGDANRGDVWASVNARIEGGSISNADPGNGNLNNFRVSQLYVEAGNILLEHVKWRIGTLDFWPGDLGLYDIRGAELFYDTLGGSALFSTTYFDLLVGIGDAGYGIRGTAYDTIFTGGVWARMKLPHFDLGLGGQGYYEPSTPGNSNSPYQTPGVNYEDYYRQQVVQNFLLAHPGQELEFPSPTSRTTSAGKFVGYLGFGGFGPLQWDSLYVWYQKLYPLNSYQETYQGTQYTIYIHDLTNHRYNTQIGNEAHFTVVPKWVDLAWGVLWGMNRNFDNTIAAGYDNYTYASTVARVQVYITEQIHWLTETSLAQEHSLNGNLWREHEDSVFQNDHGVPDVQGLQYGDTAFRNTWQGKAGFVFNPVGRGIFTRPSLRLLYGLQYSNVQDDFGNTFSTSLAQYNQFPSGEFHWHQVIALEAEGWF